MEPGLTAAPALGCHRAGEAVVVSPSGALDPGVEQLARNLARDPDHLSVLVDLQGDYPADSWEPLIGLLAGQERGLWLLPARPALAAAAANREPGGRPPPAGATVSSMVRLGQWLAEQTGQTVRAQDGPALLAAGGRMFVPAEAGSGWLRLRAGEPAASGSRRFPEPGWECAVLADPAVLGPDSVAEPLPAGAWLRSPGADARLADDRRWLRGALSCPPGQVIVVLGRPGSPAVPPADIVRFWARLDRRIRPCVRFAYYGPPPESADGVPYGQVLADVLGEQVALSTGLPVGGWRAGDEARVRTLGADGSPGWHPFVSALGYRPRLRRGDQLRRPALLGCRPPAAGLHEVADGVYSWADGIVLEIIPSGLWLRRSADPAGGAAVRCRPADEAGPVLLVDGRPGESGGPGAHAAAVLRALDHDISAICRLQPGPGARPAGDRPGSRAPGGRHRRPPDLDEPDLDEPNLDGEVTGGSGETLPDKARAAGAGAAAMDAVGRPAAAKPGPEPDAPGPAASAARPSLPERVRPARPPVIRLESMPDAPGPDLTRLTEAAAAGGPLAGLGSPAVAGAASPELAVGPEDLLGPPPAPDQALDAVGTGEPAAQPAASAAPPPAASRAGPVPVPVALDSPALAQAAPQLEACVIPPRRGLERERSWVRQAMSHQYDAAAAAVLRMLSEMPGLRTSASPAADLLTELVAARLYLTGQPQQVDDMVRTATVGPHVPFGRCVAAGLRRLPSYRGPTRLRATLAEAEWQWYGHRDLVTEWAFCPALADGRVRLPGTVDFLIWSMTARRANLLEPSVQSQVIFLPGTNFKVLAVQAGEQREVLLREVSAAEIGADGHLADGPRPLDQVALSGLERASGLWRQEPPAGELPERYASRFASPPGLAVRTRASAGSVTGPGVG